MCRAGWTAVTCLVLVAGQGTAGARAAGTSDPLRLNCPAAGASDPLSVPAGLAVAGVTPAVADPVRAVALQHLEEIADVTDFTSYRAKLDCELAQLVLPQLLRGHANLVVINEYAGLEVFATGERGAVARQLAPTPVGRGAADAGGVPVGAAAGLLAVGGQYAAALAKYHLASPGSPGFSVHDLFTAATDTFVRGFIGTLRDAAAKYSALAGGPVYLVGSAPMPAKWHAELQATTAGPQYLADCLALYADPSQCATAPPDRLYIADENAIYNVAFVVGPHPADPDHPFIGLQRKVNLVTLEGPSLLDLTPGAMQDVQPIAIPGTGVRLGIAISLDAFETGNRHCGNAHPDSLVACIEQRGANVLIQLEANDSQTPNASWPDYIDTSQDSTGGKNPQWQPLTYMDSAWLATADPGFHFRYAVISFMVGNLLDIAFDGQSAIFSRGGTHCGHWVGNSRFLGPYPSGGPDEAPYAGFAGDKPQFLAVAPWVIGDTDRTTLKTRARAMAPGSGAPEENGYRETAVAADLVMNGPVEPSGGCAAAAETTAAVQPGAVAAAATATLPSTGRAAVAGWLPWLLLLPLLRTRLRRRGPGCEFETDMTPTRETR